MSVDRRPASLGRRVGAYAVDAGIAFLVLLLAAGILAGISFGTGGAFPLVLAGAGAYAIALVWFLVYTWMQGGTGSLGMRMTGLQLAHAADDQPLGFGRALGRNIVWGLGSAIVVGMFSPLFDASPWRRGWHDAVSGAVMTDIAGHGAPAAPLTAAAAAAAESPESSPVPSPVPPGASFAPPGAAGPAAVPAGPILPSAPRDEAWAGEPQRPATPGGVISFVPGVTDPVPPRRSTGPVPMPEPQPAVEDTRIVAEDRPVARLVWDDGTRQAVYGRTLFGRNPSPEPGAAVSPVRDETLSLSKTHFELTTDEDLVWVIDRHSTNGVVVRRGPQRHDVVPGEPTRVRAGDVLEFGDRHVMVEVAP